MTIAIIGGSGLDTLPGFEVLGESHHATRWGLPAAAVLRGRYAGREVLFLPRHGVAHHLPPHRINYRANLRALADCGASGVLAVAAVGGIAPGMAPGCLAVPHQIIDYTWGREHTYFDGASGQVAHVDFTDPYDAGLRGALLEAGRATGIALVARGVYGATQGPRLESAAEIERLARDGCDLVGMTGMPEAALARELALPYACLAVVANRAAGRGDGPLALAAILATLAHGMGSARRVLEAAVAGLPA